MKCHKMYLEYCWRKTKVVLTKHVLQRVRVLLKVIHSNVAISLPLIVSTEDQILALFRVTWSLLSKEGLWRCLRDYSSHLSYTVAWVNSELEPVGLDEMDRFLGVSWLNHLSFKFLSLLLN